MSSGRRPPSKRVAAAIAAKERTRDLSSDTEPEITTEALQEARLDSAVSTTKRATSSKRVKRPLFSASAVFAQQYASTASQAALPVELMRLIASHLFGDLLDIWHLLLANKAWYKALVEDELQWKAQARLVGCKVRKAGKDWMQTFIIQSLSLCVGCRSKTQVLSGCLPFAPKDARVCQNCQWRRAHFRCISHSQAMQQFDLTEGEIQHLPTKGTRYTAGKDRHKNYYLESSIKEIAEAKASAEIALNLLSSDAWEAEAAACEGVMLDMYTGDPKSLQAVFDHVKEDQEASRVSVLVNLHLDLVIRNTPITLKDIELLVDLYYASIKVEEDLDEILAANSRSHQLSLAQELLEQKPGLIRNNTRVTWRELLAGGFQKDLSCFFNALDKATLWEQKKAAVQARKEGRAVAARERHAEARAAGLGCSRSGCGKEKALRCDQAFCGQHCPGPCKRHHK